MNRAESKVPQIFNALNIHTYMSAKFFIYSLDLKLEDGIKVNGSADRLNVVADALLRRQSEAPVTPC